MSTLVQQPDTDGVSELLNESICETKMVIHLLWTTMVDNGKLGRTSVHKIDDKN